MKDKTYRQTSPLILLCFMNVFGFLMLAFMRENLFEGIKTLTTGIIFVALLVICYCLIKLLNMGDPFLLLPVTALLSVGLLMLTRIDEAVGKRQMMWFFISIAVYFISFFIYKGIKKRDRLFVLYALASIGLFAATIVFGRTVNGAKNWIYIGSQGVQPSEFIRLLFVFALSSVLSKKPGRGLINTEWKKSLFIMFYVYINLGFLVLQREWGIAVLFFLIYFSLYFVFGRHRILLWINSVIVAAGCFVGYKVLYHIETRVSMWLNPFSDPSGRGYQIVQSLIAIASGGFTGQGLGNGSPYYVPLVESDFIFSGICEEFGILGGIGVILLYFIFVYRGFKIAMSVPDSFDKKVALGLSAMFSFQIFIILGGVIKLIPLTGITLPFISYGGSSLVTSFMALGILQAISVKE
ncbi:MAG: FtsW/RodA/SpoVE family cell cycle protein, partial [Clostridia bacterium]|nr:FtsW/RodA/SpoVE family cell cycle protein [Clostridia bacterium]